MKSRPIPLYLYLVAAALSAWPLAAQTTPKVTAPQDSFGFNIGDDYQIANYSQLEAHWKKLAAESDRMKLVSIGKTEEGREQWMAIISSQIASVPSGAPRAIHRSLTGFQSSEVNPS